MRIKDCIKCQLSTVFVWYLKIYFLFFQLDDDHISKTGYINATGNVDIAAGKTTHLTVALNS